MKTWVALLRGINVGGARPLPMKDLVATLCAAGFRSVHTYIQSGNVVFQTSKGTPHSMGIQIACLIKKRFGLEVPVMVLRDTELTDAISNNPFLQATAEPKTLHVCFLSEAPASPDLESLTKIRTPEESFVLKGKVFYLHTPEGAGNSKLAAKLERALRVNTTARNWRTVIQLQAMCDEIAAAP